MPHKREPKDVPQWAGPLSESDWVGLLLGLGLAVGLVLASPLVIRVLIWALGY
jgi:hypothetical protein